MQTSQDAAATSANIPFLGLQTLAQHAAGKPLSYTYFYIPLD